MLKKAVYPVKTMKIIKLIMPTSIFISNNFKLNS